MFNEMDFDMLIFKCKIWCVCDLYVIDFSDEDEMMFEEELMFKFK